MGNVLMSAMCNGGKLAHCALFLFQIFLRVASNSEDGEIVRGGKQRSAPPQGREEEVSSEESGEKGGNRTVC